MELTRRAFGQEHPYTLASMANLASKYQNQGRRKEMKNLWRRDPEEECHTHEATTTGMKKGI